MNILLINLQKNPKKNKKKINTFKNIFKNKANLIIKNWNNIT